MLRSLHEILGYQLDATDDEIGKIKDFYFDDQAWVVRYAVADTRRFLPGKKVLISPTSMGLPDGNDSKVPVHLSSDQIREAPSEAEELPVSRQHEVDLAKHFTWPSYWTSPMGGAVVAGVPLHRRPVPSVGSGPGHEQRGDPHLRSLDEVRGYRVEGSDEEVGPLKDLIVDTDGWVIRYVVVDTHRWLPGGKVLIAPEWIDQVDWGARTIRSGLSKASIEGCPPYDPSEPVSRSYEGKLYDYYGRPYSWAPDEPKPVGK